MTRTGWTTFLEHRGTINAKIRALEREVCMINKIAFNTSITNSYSDTEIRMFSRDFGDPRRWKEPGYHPFQQLLEGLATQDPAAKILAGQCRWQGVKADDCYTPLGQLRERFVKRQIGEAEYKQIAHRDHPIFRDT